MSDDLRAIQLEQLANIVIDAYLRRDERFKPDFQGRRAVLYLSRPTGAYDHPDLQLGHWYQAEDSDHGNRS
jgi:hypothetical protein